MAPNWFSKEVSNYLDDKEKEEEVKITNYSGWSYTTNHRFKPSESGNSGYYFSSPTEENVDKDPTTLKLIQDYKEFQKNSEVEIKIKRIEVLSNNMMGGKGESVIGEIYSRKKKDMLVVYSRDDDYHQRKIYYFKRKGDDKGTVIWIDGHEYEDDTVRVGKKLMAYDDDVDTGMILSDWIEYFRMERRDQMENWLADIRNISGNVDKMNSHIKNLTSENEHLRKQLNAMEEKYLNENAKYLSQKSLIDQYDELYMNHISLLEKYEGSGYNRKIGIGAKIALALGLIRKQDLDNDQFV